MELPEQTRTCSGKPWLLSNRTGGALDPCLYPVTKLWGFTTGHYRVPEQAEIQEALAHTGSKQLILKNSCAHLAAGRKWILEPWERAGPDAWRRNTWKRGKVSPAACCLWEEMCRPTEKSRAELPGRFGIQDPAGAGTLGTLSLQGTWAVVTSGGYQRYFEAGGVRYCHILDPETGAPAVQGSPLSRS